ncbi:hypothetical protein B0H11DRAFT_2035434 [Mycena galericulata]|nr:hypothetical protein B0H11DRAFT_2035434 [Mycena galericulata]
MSFGVGVGDIIKVTKMTWRLYQICKESSDDFRRMSTELLSLHALLSETMDYLEEHGEELAPLRRYRLTTLLDGCSNSLQDLEALYSRYESLSTRTHRIWGRVRFSLKDLSHVQQRFVSSVTMLASFNTALIHSSTTRIEKKLNKLFMVTQAGLREGSAVSGSDVELAIQSPDVWAVLRRDVEDVGISAVVVEEHHEFILNWFQTALAQGLLEENAGVVRINNGGISNRNITLPDDECISSRSCTPTNDVEDDASEYHTAHSHLSHDTSERNTFGHFRQVMSAAINSFDTEEQRMRNERSVAELPDPLAASTISSLSPPPSSFSLSSQTSRPAVRKRRPFGLVEKLFQKRTAIVQATSDGDIDRVARLISLGMDVNAVDRWGRSALSMCGYGGHVVIARLLLEHGANINNKDVDGDTPKSLAAQRGHVDLLHILEEEEEMRELRAREASGTN